MQFFFLLFYFSLASKQTNKIFDCILSSKRLKWKKWTKKLNNKEKDEWVKKTFEYFPSPLYTLYVDSHKSSIDDHDRRQYYYYHHHHYHHRNTILRSSSFSVVVMVHFLSIFMMIFLFWFKNSPCFTTNIPFEYLLNGWWYSFIHSFICMDQICTFIFQQQQQQQWQYWTNFMITSFGTWYIFMFGNNMERSKGKKISKKFLIFFVVVVVVLVVVVKLTNQQQQQQQYCVINLNRVFVWIYQIFKWIFGEKQFQE